MAGLGAHRKLRREHPAMREGRILAGLR
jgi:hypothetical protein